MSRIITEAHVRFFAVHEQNSRAILLLGSCFIITMNFFMSRSDGVLQIFMPK